MRPAPELHGVRRSRWRLADLRQAVACVRGYSLPGISRALTRPGVSRPRGRLRVHSPDLAYRQKMAWIARARSRALQRAGAVTGLYGDEFSLYRQPTLAASYAPRGQAPLADLSPRSNGYHRFSGALDLATGQVTWLARAKMGVDNRQRFLAKLRAAYPARRLSLSWDNWPVHQHPDLLATAARLGVEILWLPTYAPWTNPIEKLWRWLTEDLLRHHRLADQWPELQRRVKARRDRFAGPSPGLLRYVGEART